MLFRKLKELYYSVYGINLEYGTCFVTSENRFFSFVDSNFQGIIFEYRSYTTTNWKNKNNSGYDVNKCSEYFFQYYDVNQQEIVSYKITYKQYKLLKKLLKNYRKYSDNYGY